MSNRKKSELKVFKLRSGEEIIAQVESKARGKIKVLRPMRILNSVQADPFTGMRKQVVYFSDWLGSASELHATIPSNFVVMELSPDPDLIELYDRQIESDDAQKILRQQPKPPVPPVSEEELKKSLAEADKEIEELLKQYAEEQKKTGTSGIPQLPPNPFSDPTQGIRPQNSILFSVSIPQEILQSWVESGFIDYLKECLSDFTSTEFLEDMMNDDEDEVEDLEDDVDPAPKPKKKKQSKGGKREKISKDKWLEPPAEKKENPDFGNSHEDWSPYIKDYLPDPPKKDEDA